jgi:uncharacterized protein YkuJ
MNKTNYNILVRFYNQTKGKLKRLILAGKNLRKQEILRKRLLRLHERLSSWGIVLKGAFATTVLSSLLCLSTTETNAQTFGAVQTNPFSLVDIGNRSFPTFVDLDDDGDMDLMVGESGGNFMYFENTGTVSLPVFGAAQTNPFSLTDIGSISKLAFKDIDNDGDLDMMSGDYVGDFYYFENTGSVSLPIFGAVQSNPFSLIRLGSKLSPIFVDLNNDNDFDLLRGEFGGGFRFCENTGNVSVPTFGGAQDLPFSLTDIGWNSTPSFADLDNDGDLDLMSGEEYGNFKYFENTGSVSSPIFGAVQTNPFSLTDIGSNSTSSFADLDNDGDLDLISGDYTGIFKYFENISTSEINLKGNLVSIVDEDNTPSTLDDTDFGNQDYCSGTIVKTFTIENSGLGGLTFSNPTISGADAADFSISSNPTSPVFGNGSTTFQVTFNPSGVGVKSATISVTNNDANEATYNFDIQGTGTDGTSTFYEDADSDSYGDLGSTTSACTAPGGYVANSTDCDDANATVHSAPVITSQPSNVADLCDLYNTTFSVSANFATGYQWEVSTDNGGSWNNASGLIYTGENTATLNLLLTPSTYNNYKYRCVLSGGCLPDATSNEVLLTVRAPFTVPTGLSTTSVDLNNATLNWTNVVGATELRVALRKVGTTVWHNNNAVYADSYIFNSASGFSLNSTYEWKVRLRNAVGCWGDWSTTETFYVCTYATPTALNETGIFSNKVTLNWSHPGADEVRIALRKEGNPFWYYKNEPYANSYEWNASFTKNANYEWMIRVRCGTTWGAWSALGTFVSGTVSGMIQQDDDTFSNIDADFTERNIVVYPNPNNGDFTISSTHEGTFKIVNELGQVIQTVELAKDNNQSVVTSENFQMSLQPGIYFVSGTIEGEVITKKIVVQ